MPRHTRFVCRSVAAALTLTAALGAAAALVRATPPPQPGLPTLSTVTPPVPAPLPTFARQSAVADPRVARSPERSDGALILADGTFCPLRHTGVEAEVAGMLARVTVTQRFENPTTDAVEAVYTFPLPSDSAVDDMTMRVGTRVIRGLIERREEAKRIYEAAKRTGHTAALLDQERPNIFTQAVANIPPGATVEVVISYVETLEYEAGRFSFVFPMVVGPRYMPGTPTSSHGAGWSRDTTAVPDASRISPPVAGVHVGEKGSRAGHDISLQVTLDAGVPIQSLQSGTHAIDVTRVDERSAVVRLRDSREIPNRDFVLDYAVAGGTIADAFIAHARPGVDGTDPVGHFALILQPPDRIPDEDATPRELVFVLDTSGSMMGYPIETAKAVMRRAISTLRPGDTFNLITFAGDTRVLFPHPVSATADNVTQAVAFLDRQSGGGGTEMMTAIRAALGDDGQGGSAPARPSPISTQATPAFKVPGPFSSSGTWGPPSGSQTPSVHSDRVDAAVRIVCFMTDGYVGNDQEIIGEVQKHPGARVFSFGIGSSVNRFLLDGMARAGRGEVEYVLQADDADAAASRFYERVHTPVLTDVTVDWGTLPVVDVLPARVPDLFAAKPIVIVGRYTGAASGTITLRGRRAGQGYERAVPVVLPRVERRHRAIGQLWARMQVGELRARGWQGLEQGGVPDALREAITSLGLRYRLMTEFTSFVAVEERIVVEGNTRRTIRVPVEMPAGVSPRGVFGGEADTMMIAQAAGAGRPTRTAAVGAMPMPLPPAPTAAVMTAPTTAPGPAQEAVADQSARKQRTDGRAKLHVDLLAITVCLDAGAMPQACTGSSDGRIRVRITVGAAAGPETRAALARLGFVADAREDSATILVGTIAAGQLDALGALDGVKAVAPAPVR